MNDQASPSDPLDDAPINAHGPEWRQWVLTNVQAGCDPADMVSRMVAGGWTPSAAAHAISFAEMPQVERVSSMPLPELPRVGDWVFDGQRMSVTMRVAVPAIALCENVLTRQECDELIAFANQRVMLRSTIVNESDGHAHSHPERTSTTLMLSRGETELVARVESRLAALTGWPLENGEGLQILRYASGEEYRAHFDAFPGGAAGAEHHRHGGQRVNTVLVYLQSPDRGGGTYFPNLGLTICPKPGSAVLFHNVNSVGNRANETLHAGMPVQHGQKVVMTYWQRERAFD